MYEYNAHGTGCLGCGLGTDPEPLPVQPQISVIDPEFARAQAEQIGSRMPWYSWAALGLGALAMTAVGYRYVKKEGYI
jgi:hypothetical protein